MPIAAIALSAQPAPALMAMLGLHDALLVAGAILPFAALVGWSALHRADAAAVVPERQLTVLRGVPMFAALPLTTLEMIASRLAPVRFRPGESLMREGEAGDRFFVIEEGEVEVEVADRVVRRLGSGSAVGEIALLRRIPRTATVRAIRDTSAWALDGAVFAAAVTSRPDSIAAEAIIAQRLPVSKLSGEAPA